MAKDLVNMPLLYDLYGGMLTDKQREFFEQYYYSDLSLAEIAENEGISRQGARDNIVRAEETLKEFEEKLALAARFRAIREGSSQIEKIAFGIAELNSHNYFDERIRVGCEKISEIVRAME